MVCDRKQNIRCEHVVVFVILRPIIVDENGIKINRILAPIYDNWQPVRSFIMFIIITTIRSLCGPMPATTTVLWHGMQLSSSIKCITNIALPGIDRIYYRCMPRAY